MGLFHTCHSFKELRGKIISEPDLDIRLVLSKSISQEQKRRGCACCSYPCGNQGAKFLKIHLGFGDKKSSAFIK